MPHETTIIIQKLTQPVAFGEHAHDAKPPKCRVWWFAALPLVTFVIGLLAG